MSIERILIADGDYEVLDKLGSQLSAHGYEVFLATTAGELTGAATEHGCDAAIIELELPDADGFQAAKQLAADLPEIAVTVMGHPMALGGRSDELLQSHFGYLQKPVSPGQALLAIQQAEEMHRLREENRMLRRQWENDEGPDDLVSQSPLMIDLLRQAATAADTDQPVAIYGAPGTEKEIVALYIHRCSRRADGPFIHFECGRAPKATEEAELFGREYHGSNGAIWRGTGRLELAAGGTLFVENLDELSPRCQAKLLRFVEEGKFLRAESDHSGHDAPYYDRRSGPQFADVRIICAFSSDAEAEAGADGLREDLLFRLNALSITLPSLARRREDIVPLAERFVRRFAVEISKGVHGISDEAARLLEQYDWPGNLAELRDTIRSAVVGAQHNLLLPEDLLRGPSRRVISGVIGGVTGPTLEDAERQFIVKTLHEARGNKAETARRLRVTRTTLSTKLAKYRARGLLGQRRRPAAKEVEGC